MGHLWVRDVEDERSWIVVPLEGQAVRLDRRPLRIGRRKRAVPRRGIASHVWLFSRNDDRGAVWMLLVGCTRHVSVNGYPVTTGFRLLEHRDEIHVGRVGRVWFSTERLATIEPFESATGAMHCARTKVRLTPGMPTVRCPQCSTWYAQTERFQGWTYGPTCVMCRCPTDLDAGFRWVPGSA